MSQATHHSHYPHHTTHPHRAHHQKRRWPHAVWVLSSVLFAIIGIWFMRRDKEDSVLLPSVQTTEVSVQVDAGILPEGFPADFPKQGDELVLQNHVTTVGGGKVQATRQIQSTKSLNENYTLYKNYLEKNNWSFQYLDAASDSVHTIFATAKGKEMNVVMSRNASGVVVVDATMVMYGK